MRIVIAVFALTLAGSAVAQQTHQVRGYVRANGTYVPPHIQTNPDGNAFNNWSSHPNINPFTAQRGTVDPVQAQAAMRARQSQRPNANSIWGE